MSSPRRLSARSDWEISACVTRGRAASRSSFVPAVRRRRSRIEGMLLYNVLRNGWLRGSFLLDRRTVGKRERSDARSGAAANRTRRTERSGTHGADPPLPR